MIESTEELVTLIESIYGDAAKPPRLAILSRYDDIANADDQDLLRLAKEIGTTRPKLRDVQAAGDPVQHLFNVSLAQAQQDATVWERALSTVGQLLVGRLAERSFESKYRRLVKTDELRLEDHREQRSDTDYRVLNGSGRPVFRMNIKFHGTPFRKAKELVGLEPEDCFALATYKIILGINKQTEEHLPYVFVIVSVPNMTASTVGAVIPENAQHLAALIAASKLPKKRDVEDRIVDWVLESAQPAGIRKKIAGFQERIDDATWRVLSARRADKLLRKLLFERVYAVRVRAFTRNYRNAELDMHFSFSNDMTPLEDFLEKLKQDGLPSLISYLERGTY